MSAGKLDDDQISALDEGPPGWRNLDRIRWFEQLDSLVSWCGRSRRLPTSRTADSEGKRLGTWLAFQRKRNRSGLLKDDQIAALDDRVPGWRGRNS